MTTAATSFVFSNASTRTRSSFGRSASASQMVDRLFSAALHRGPAQRSSDGAVTTATGDEGVAAASPTWGAKKIIFLIRDIDDATRAGASMESRVNFT